MLDPPSASLPVLLAGMKGTMHVTPFASWSCRTVEAVFRPAGTTSTGESCIEVLSSGRASARIVENAVHELAHWAHYARDFHSEEDPAGALRRWRASSWVLREAVAFYVEAMYVRSLRMHPVDLIRAIERGGYELVYGSAMPSDEELGRILDEAIRIGEEILTEDRAAIDEIVSSIQSILEEDRPAGPASPSMFKRLGDLFGRFLGR